MFVTDAFAQGTQAPPVDNSPMAQFFGGGLSYRLAVTPRAWVLSRLSGGALFAQARDPVEVETRDRGVALAVKGSNGVLDLSMPFVAPELGLLTTLGPLTVGATLALAFFPTTAPSFHRYVIGNPAATCSPYAGPDTGACAPNSVFTSITAGRSEAIAAVKALRNSCGRSTVTPKQSKDCATRAKSVSRYSKHSFIRLLSRAP